MRSKGSKHYIGKKKPSPYVPIIGLSDSLLQKLLLGKLFLCLESSGSVNRTSSNQRAETLFASKMKSVPGSGSLSEMGSKMEQTPASVPLPQ